LASAAEKSPPAGKGRFYGALIRASLSALNEGHRMRERLVHLKDTVFIDCNLPPEPTPQIHDAKIQKRWRASKS
jgi:hypothetical protein